MTHVSLFSGIGGIDLAAEWAGFKTVLFCEMDPYAQSVLRKHWPDVPIVEDVKDVDRGAVDGPVTLVSGGFPCQAHSLAGLKKREKDERYLWPEMLRVIQDLQPSWVCAENVYGTIVDGTADVVKNDLENEGYETGLVVLPAYAFGASFRGDRAFYVATAKSVRHRRWPSDSREAEGLDKDKQERRQIWGEAERRIVDAIQNQEALPEDIRGDYGLPDWAHRLRCLGNAVCPQQVYPILQAIAEIEKSND